MNDEPIRNPLSEAEADALGDEIAEDAAILDSATYALLVKIRPFDEARGWARQGAESCAHWLSWRVGIGLFTARQKVAVAHRLLEFPLVVEAFRRGQLSVVGRGVRVRGLGAGGLVGEQTGRRCGAAARDRDGVDHASIQGRQIIARGR